MTRSLVIHAGRYGSTERVAAKIAATLGQHGAAVDLRAADQLGGPIQGYDLVVLGGALYNGRWHRGARRLLRSHDRDLAAVDVAVFATGPRDNYPDTWRRARAQLDRALAREAWLRPLAVRVFGGVDPPGKRLQRDLRDWDAIQAWAASLLPRTAARR